MFFIIKDKQGTYLWVFFEHDTKLINKLLYSPTF